MSNIVKMAGNTAKAAIIIKLVSFVVLAGLLYIFVSYVIGAGKGLSENAFSGFFGDDKENEEQKRREVEKPAILNEAEKKESEGKPEISPLPRSISYYRNLAKTLWDAIDGLGGWTSTKSKPLAAVNALSMKELAVLNYEYSIVRRKMATLREDIMYDDFGLFNSDKSEVLEKLDNLTKNY